MAEIHPPPVGVVRADRHERAEPGQRVDRFLEGFAADVLDDDVHARRLLHPFVASTKSWGPEVTTSPAPNPPGDSDLSSPPTGAVNPPPPHTAVLVAAPPAP